MTYDKSTMTTAMLAAARQAAGSDWSGMKGPFRHVLGSEQSALGRLFDVRAAGEIGDDAVAAELGRERRVMLAELAELGVVAGPTVEEAVRRALDGFRSALSDALVGGGRRSARARQARNGRAAAGKVQHTPISRRRLNARPDTVDFRDLVYVPTLVEVGTEIPLARYRRARVPILDQGEEGACTGFGLATMVHYLLRTRKVKPDRAGVSPRMLYAMARRYDEWPGESYEGSSCRGAMKGWHKHGVCAEALWRHDPDEPDFTLTETRSADAQQRALGAYFRVNHKDLVAMHAAITEVGVLYASADVHEGWDGVDDDGRIPFGDTARVLGGHAFAIVAYDREGFWLQNSWGRSWGRGGFGHISYADWLKHGSDVWVARLGVPIEAAARAVSVRTSFTASSRAKAYAYDDVRPHVVSVGNNGALRTTGNIGTTPEAVRRIVNEDFARITAGWKTKRLVLYAHGGLVGEDPAVQRVAEYRRTMLDRECYPLAFVWHSDYWSTITAMLEDVVKRRRSEGAIDATNDFMLDRLDDGLEPLARAFTGKASWDEMKENALAATRSAAGAVRFVAAEIAGLVARTKVDVHLIAHSAGSILLAPLVEHLSKPISAGGLGVPVTSCTLWAPACTMALFDGTYAPAIRDGRIGRTALYTLTDEAEQDDHCARIYNKSLLYLVSNAFEARPRIPLVRPDGVPLLGMAKFVERHRTLGRLIRDGRVRWVQAPNTLPVGTPGASGSSAHGAFDDDQATVLSTLGFILDGGRRTGVTAKAAAELYQPKPGASRLRSLRAGLEDATR